MEHIAIDLGGRESQVCVRSPDGEIVLERRVATLSLKRLLATRKPSRVIVETCTEAFPIAEIARTAGHDVRVVPATLVRTLGVGARGIKTDRRDARALSEVSCRVDLPSVHLPSARARELKDIANAREVLVGARTALINSVRGYLRRRLLGMRVGGTATFPDRVRTLVLSTAEGIPGSLESLLTVIESATEQIKLQTKELERLAETDDVCRRLMTVPGVGPLTAIRFVAVVDEPGRFASAHQIESYLGLTPGERSSSDRTHRTGITKAGSRRLRSTLIQAAWSARRTHGIHPMLMWTKEVEHRRGAFVATVALARKLAGILFAIWRDGTTYTPQRGAAAEVRPTRT
jgi:transposase